jgi:predicted nucleic acid-binding protein
LNRLSPIKSIVPDADLIRRAVEAHSAYGLHFYDGLIIAAAERAGCSRIWSEDFNSGQEYFGVTAANPFV